MNGTYNLQIVALSVIVAMIASYTALDLAGRVGAASAQRAWYWLIGGALAMGAGIWSMHFIGMLAFQLPIPIAYDIPITLLSLLIAVLVSALALWMMRKKQLNLATLTVSATLMGIGISAMHYTGMLAMRMSPAIHYTPALFVASVVIAIAASLAALLIAFHLRSRKFGQALLAKLGSSVVMGLAISGMHYTGMAAARFAPDSMCLAAESASGLPSGSLAVAVGIVTLMILGGTLVVSSLDAHFAKSLHAAVQRLRGVALYDTLTGLPNRMLMQDRLEKAMHRAARSGKMCALMFVDLDRFKGVNERHGHRVGDLLLQQAGERMSACVRREDTVARLGADKFVVVLADVQSPADAKVIARKLVAEVSRRFTVGSHQPQLSASVGISMYPGDAPDILGLVAKADAAMYQVKKGGRNGVRLFSNGRAPLASARST